MSGFEGHMKGGIFASVVYVFLLLVLQLVFHPFAWVEYPFFVGLCIFGALWPDTDVGSTSRIIVYAIFFIIDFFLIFVFKYYFEAALFGLFTMLPAVSKHRGWTHSKFWTMIVGLPLLAPSFIPNEFLVDVHIYEYRNLIYFGVPYYGSFLFGVASHLILDKHPYFVQMRSKANKKKKKGGDEE